MPFLKNKKKVAMLFTQKVVHFSIIPFWAMHTLQTFR